MEFHMVIIRIFAAAMGVLFLYTGWTLLADFAGAVRDWRRGKRPADESDEVISPVQVAGADL